MIKNMFQMTRKRLILDLILLSILFGIFFEFYSVLHMPGTSYHGPAASTDSSEQAIATNLKKHVDILAGQIGQRNTPTTLDSSVAYIKDSLKALGLEAREHEFKVDDQVFKNIDAELKGTDPTAETLLIGAHYDSVNGSPGANDNGSGVASVLELARLSVGSKHKMNIRFVFFASEEPPYFSSEEMGSYHYLQLCLREKIKIQGLIVMETLGYYTDAPNSQSYPAGFVPGYPTVGNFIAFIGNEGSRALVEKCISVFRSECNFPSEGVSAPNWVNGVDWSDQYWFWRNGIPGVMITDTAPYRYPHYHSLQDTPDKLNYPSFARVVGGVSKVVNAITAGS